MLDQLSGLGLSVAVHETIAHCQKKLEGRPQPWAHLDYLGIGVTSHDVITPELVTRMRDAKLAPAVHLLEVNLVRPLAQQRAVVDTLLRLVEQLEPACVEEDIGFWQWGTTELEQHMLPPIFDEETADIVAKNVAELQKSAGVPFYAENPPVHCDLGTLDLLAFMEHVAEASGCKLVLDIGHLVGYCAITDREPDEYLRQWKGIQHVRELHVAGYTLSPDSTSPMWFDDHAEAITDYSLDLIQLVLELAGRALPITLEQEGAKLVRVQDHITRVSRRFFS
ncbi:MAG: DUF692 family multinuclear iron-containing protein [Kofleriaceae bacterium]